MSYVSRIIEPRRRVEETSYTYNFDSVECPGSGYAFDCNARGVMFVATDVHAASLARCRAAVAAGTMVEVGVQRYVHAYWEPAVARCDCGARVYLDDALSNECERCHRWYNGSAQLLRDPREWDPDDAYAVFGPQNSREDY